MATFALWGNSVGEKSTQKKGRKNTNSASSIYVNVKTNCFPYGKLLRQLVGVGRKRRGRGRERGMREREEKSSQTAH